MSANPSLATPSLATRSLAAFSLTALCLAVVPLAACSKSEPAGPNPVDLAAEPLVAPPLPAAAPLAASSAVAPSAAVDDEPSTAGTRPGGALDSPPGADALDRASTAGDDTIDEDAVDSFRLIEVRPGESLYSLAALVEVTPEHLAELNGMDVTQPLLAGSNLRLPRDPFVSAADIEDQRDRAFAQRLERYVAGRGGEVGVTLRRVQTGDTAWSIAHGDAAIPTWVLAAYNPDVDLDRLHIGDELRLPLLGDSVVESTSHDVPMAAASSAETRLAELSGLAD